MTYVISDIHGNTRRFESVMKQINLQPEDKLYILGDVIDRYPDGIKILRKIMKMPNVKMLLGNHEYMMLNALDTPFDPDNYEEYYEHVDRIKLWYRNGGRVTHDYLKHIRKDIRAEVFEYLRGLPLNIKIVVNGQEYRLIHGSPIELFERYRFSYSDKAEFAVWHRYKGFDMDFDDQNTIFGHTPTEYYTITSPMRIWYSEDRKNVGIDCGSGYPTRNKRNSDIPMITRLACLRLDDMKEFYSEEPEEGEDNG